MTWRYDHAAGTVYDGAGQVICYVAGRHHGDPSIGEKIASTGGSTVSARIEALCRTVTERADLPPEIKADVITVLNSLVERLQRVDEFDAFTDARNEEEVNDRP